MPAVRDPVVTFQVKINGSPLRAELQIALVHVIVDQRLGVPDLLSLAFHDPERTVLETPGLGLGAEVVVSSVVPGGGSSTTLFDGDVTALEVEYDGTGHLATVRGLDRSHRLDRAPRTRTFLKSSYSDVVKKLAQEAGLHVQVEATQPIHEHILQYHQTDLAFLRSLAAEVGFDLSVDGKKLRFVKPTPASGAPAPGDLVANNPLQLVLGENLQSLRATATSTGQVGSVEVRGWDPKQKREIVGAQANVKPDGATNGVPPADFTKGFARIPAGAVGTPYQTQAEVDAATKAFAQEVVAPRIEIEGVAHGEPTLKAGSTVSIGQAGARFDGKYTVTATRHVYDPGEGYRTELSVSGRSDRSLRGLVTGTAPSPPGGAHAGPSGVVTAVVTNTKDPENLGRVKVKFPWLTNEHESAWARPVHLMAGNGYGALLIPEVNDEVLVAFEHGDANRPYVVGSLYNGKDKPQKSAADLVKNGKTAQRRIETPTLNRLVFFDHSGTKEGITLRTGDDKFFLDLDKTNTKVVLSSNGDVTIEAKTGKVAITSGQDMTLTSKANLTLEGAQKTLIKGAQVEVTAQATMKLQASGPLEAKGAIIKLN